MTQHLSDAAHFAERCLRDHPHLNTPSGIANGPYSIQQIDVPDVQRGLHELEAAGRAVERGGRWKLIGG
jgi:hypothetical protein